MTKTLIIELPDELEQRLKTQATEQNISLETMVHFSLIVLAKPGDQAEMDPIAPLLGTLAAEVNDIGEHHDHYLGDALRQELDRAEWRL